MENPFKSLFSPGLEWLLFYATACFLLSKLTSALSLTLYRRLDKHCLFSVSLFIFIRWFWLWCNLITIRYWHYENLLQFFFQSFFSIILTSVSDWLARPSNPLLRRPSRLEQSYLQNDKSSPGLIKKYVDRTVPNAAFSKEIRNK